MLEDRSLMRADDGPSKSAAPSSPAGDRQPAGPVDPDQMPEIDADAPISARSAVGQADVADGAPTAEQLLRARVFGVAAQGPGAERARLTPATLVALLLLVVSAGASLTYVLASGGASLPSPRPSLPLAAVASSAPSPTSTRTPASPSPAPSVVFVQPSTLVLLPPTVAPTLAPAATAQAATAQPDRRYAEDSLDIAYTGRWARASSSVYAGGAVAWTTSASASATLSFTGRTIAWYGPVGPTRGSAAVYLDGSLVATISQYADSFSPRRAVFRHTFGSTGTHTIRIVCIGTSGTPMVAIDELVAGS